MKTNYFLRSLMVLALVAGSFTGGAQTISDLENDIAACRDKIAVVQDSIGAVDNVIAGEQATLDSLKLVMDEVKARIKGLKDDKKALNKQIDGINKDIATIEARRDEAIVNTIIKPALLEAYDPDKYVEIKEQIDKVQSQPSKKYRDLMEKYKDYTSDLCSFLEKQRPNFAKLGWARLDAQAKEALDFKKKLMKTSYWKVFSKRDEKPFISIPYLDDIMKEILRMQDDGFNSESTYLDIINALTVR